MAPLLGWQIFYYRSDAWTNPLSSNDGRTGDAAVVAGQPGPDGVRLILTLPPQHPLAGELTRDWISPTQGGGKS